MIQKDSVHIKIEGHRGKWYAVDVSTHKGEEVFLLEHETHGDEAAALIVNADGKIILDDIWNGFSDLDDLE